MSSATAEFQDNSHARGPQLHLLSPFLLIRKLYKHRALLMQFTKREVEMEYRGSLLGILWSLLNPLFLLTVYTLVFGFIFGASFSESERSSRLDFALGLFIGLTFLRFLTDAITASPKLILGNSNYVTKVVFPLEIFPVVQTLNGLIHMGIAFIPLLIGLLVVHQGIPFTAPLGLLLVIPITLITLGAAWMLASLGVFIRDINGLTVPVSMLLMYGSAIFYSFDSVPENLRWVIEANPVAQLVNEGRKVLLFGQPLDWGILGWLILFGAFVCMSGYYFFMRTKHAFADVL